jgi:uroporphyrinogen decarboxylase
VSINRPSRFIRACLRQPVDRTPVWFLRQAGRYMPEYMAVRKHHSLLDICRTPALAAEVTITAAERLGVDAAIIFADLLLPLTPMGLDFEFVNGEGPVIHQPLRTLDQIRALRTDRTPELSYVAEAISKVASHFNNKRPTSPDSMDTLGIIGFCGAPFTLASYMIEGGSSRNYIETKKLMYASGSSSDPCSLIPDPSSAWPTLMDKLLTVLTDFAAQQVAAGADVIQVFDSWAGALSVADYRAYALAPTTELIRRIQALGVPVIYFGVDTASLLPTFRETGADVIGLDWRIPLDQGWRALGPNTAVQGNLDPITLFAPDAILEARVLEILQQAANRPGHIFNLGHGIVPNTPVDSVLRVVDLIKRHGHTTPHAPNEATSDWAIRA